MPSVIVYGPHGCGKTRHAKQLQAFFKCTRVVEDDTDREFRSGVWHALRSNPADVKAMNVLVITSSSPPADLNPEHSRRVLQFHDAMRIAGIKPIRP